MKQFEVVQAEGTVEEKRAFLRAFTRTVELDPETGKGRLEIYSLPMVPVQEKKDSLGGHPSSLTLVAGVGFDTDSRSFEWEEAEVEELAEAMA